MNIPHTAPTDPTLRAPSSRAASLFQTSDPSGCKIAIIGLPDDLGVRMNNGRPGAAHGPEAIRAQLAKFGVADPHGFAWPRVFDAGDIIPSGWKEWPTGPFETWSSKWQDEARESLNQTHSNITEAVTALLELGLLPIALGGGHDLSYPFVRAVLKHLQADGHKSFRGLYADAHLDVRETLGSGMPFRRLLTEFPIQSLELRGYSPLVNSREHTAWFLANGGSFQSVDAPISSAANAPLRFASFDMDCIDSSAAPGVSALNPAGMTTQQAARIAHELGADPTTACFDIMELCPPHDEPATNSPVRAGRTARVAAMLLLEFLAGFSKR